MKVRRIILLTMTALLIFNTVPKTTGADYESVSEEKSPDLTTVRKKPDVLVDPSEKVFCNVVGHLHVEAVSPECIQPITFDIPVLTEAEKAIKLDNTYTTLTKIIKLKNYLYNMMTDTEKAARQELLDTFAYGIWLPDGEADDEDEEMCWCGGYRKVTPMVMIENRVCPTHGGACADYFAVYDYNYYWCTFNCWDQGYSSMVFWGYVHI